MLNEVSLPEVSQLIENDLNIELKKSQLSVDQTEFDDLKGRAVNRFFGFHRFYGDRFPKGKDWSYVLRLIARLEVSEFRNGKTLKPDQKVARAICDQKLNHKGKTFAQIAQEVNLSAEDCEKIFNQSFVDENIGKKSTYARTAFQEADLVVYFLNQRDWKPGEIVDDFPGVMLGFLDAYYQRAVDNRDKHPAKFKGLSSEFVETVERKRVPECNKSDWLRVLGEILNDRNLFVTQKVNGKQVRRLMVHRLIETRCKRINDVLRCSPCSHESCRDPR